MKDYYVFATLREARYCMFRLNSIFRRNSKITKDKTTRWASGVLELTTNEWAVPAVPANRLEAANVIDLAMAEINNKYVPTLRTLTQSDFKSE